MLDFREASADVGKLALEAMRQRTKRWRSRRDKEPSLKNLKVGSAVELVINEKIESELYRNSNYTHLAYRCCFEDNLFNNDKVNLDFAPLYQSIHIFTALSALPDLQSSYQRDRKEQASLILNSTSPDPSSTSNSNSISNELLSSLPFLTQSLLGFFLVETEVLRTTRGFRDRREVEELWEDVCGKLVERLENGLRYERNPETLVGIKDALVPFVQTIEVRPN